jgi:hypothetical protein
VLCVRTQQANVGDISYYEYFSVRCVDVCRGRVIVCHIVVCPIWHDTHVRQVRVRELYVDADEPIVLALVAFARCACVYVCVCVCVIVCDGNVRTQHRHISIATSASHAIAVTRARECTRRAHRWRPRAKARTAVWQRQRGQVDRCV